jgi:hypothetical protein
MYFILPFLYLTLCKPTQPTNVSVKHNLYFSGIQQNYMYKFRLSIRSYQTVCEKQKYRRELQLTVNVEICLFTKYL